MGPLGPLGAPPRGSARPARRFRVCNLRLRNASIARAIMLFSCAISTPTRAISASRAPEIHRLRPIRARFRPFLCSGHSRAHDLGTVLVVCLFLVVCLVCSFVSGCLFDFCFVCVCSFVSGSLWQHLGASRSIWEYHGGIAELSPKARSQLKPRKPGKNQEEG